MRARSAPSPCSDPRCLTPSSRAGRAILVLAEGMHEGTLRLRLPRTARGRGNWWRRLMRRRAPTVVDATGAACRSTALGRDEQRSESRCDSSLRADRRRLHPSDRAAERLIRERVVEAVSRSLGDGRLLAPGPQEEERVRAIIDEEVAAYERRAVTTNAPLLLDADGGPAAAVRLRLWPRHPPAADGRSARRGDHRQRTTARLHHSRRSQRAGARRLLRQRRRAAPAGQARGERRRPAARRSRRRWSTSACATVRDSTP